MINKSQMSKILITGSAGFIGFHLSKSLLNKGDFVIGLDNLNDYYDVSLKRSRLKQLQEYPNYKHIDINMEDRQPVENLFSTERFDKVVNLAAQAGVRYSIKNPQAYVDSNIVGFVNLLEGCRHNNVKHFVFASSSSVYGANTITPYSVHHNVDHPISLYAASKKANELMAHSYSHLFQLPCTGLRFFTVYGPWGRPDMAYFLFTKAILEDKTINVFNHGKMKRDFTFIDDIVKGIISVLDRIAQPNPKWSSNSPDPATSYAPYKIYNIGNNKQVELSIFIQVLENILGKKANKKFLPMQAGDVQSTFADVDDLMKDTGFRPETSIEEGLEKFVDWYRSYYQY